LQDDLALMFKGTNGQYYFQGGAICIPGFWRMRDKIGMSLEEIHIQGHVPQYETKLHNSMARYFKCMAVDKPIIRNNYFFQELAWSATTNGSEETFVHGDCITPKKPMPIAAENLRLRMERQSLHMLPLSGAILFTIRMYLFPLEDLAKEPGVPARMASAI
ncbi:hypothetical protein BT96DRAFT_739609, partial [Gymnopus androsaceus JB14]